MPVTPDLEGLRGDRPGGPGVLPLIDLFPLFSQLCIVDDHHGDNPTTTTNPPLQEESNVGDSSGPFFAIYSKAAEDEDNKRVEHWQKDAEGIVIFVSPCVDIHMF
jgi:hypothetical protein